MRGRSLHAFNLFDIKLATGITKAFSQTRKNLLYRRIYEAFFYAILQFRVTDPNLNFAQYSRLAAKMSSIF